MDIDGWSQDSEAFKTITSGSQTRNQTTNKKNNHQSKNNKSLNRRQHIDASILENLHSLLEKFENQRQSCIRFGNYKKVAKLNNQISGVKKEAKQIQEELRRQQQQQEQAQICEWYRYKMENFQQIWGELFDKLKRKQQVSFKRLEVEKERQARQLQSKLSEQANRLQKRMRKNKDLVEIQNLEKSLLKNNKFEQIVKLNIGQRKKQIKRNLKVFRDQEIRKLEEKQVKKFSQKYRKKYESLKMKFELSKNEELLLYNKHEQALAKKFENSIKKNRHEHALRNSRRCNSAYK